MSRSRQLLELIAADIQQDLQDYPALQELLQQQHLSLLRRDAAGVEALNAEITVQTTVIQRRAQRRSKILRAFQLEEGAAGMQRLLAAYPEPQRQAVQTAWARLAALTAECRQLNERNGRLLAMQQEILTQLIGEQPHLYAPQAL